MYLRHKQVRKNGKTHTYWSLVQFVRHERRVRQFVVATLGKLDSPEATAGARGRPDKLMVSDQPSLVEPFDSERDVVPTD